MLTQKKTFIFQKIFSSFVFVVYCIQLLKNRRNMMKRLYAAYGSNLNETLIK
ncbi:hypothetical protein HMPREF1148_1953 [Selenomonas sp. FOBRC6]|nr:hypothetical protein HMPREF1148_1953 [Selenomonas sp. FOBRC6]